MKFIQVLRMKSSLLAFVFIIMVSKLFAQDTIIKINGEQVIANVLEITGNEVKYKRFQFEDGPLYVSYKTEIQLVKFADGRIEQFQKKRTSMVVDGKQTVIINGIAYSKKEKIIPFGATRWKYEDKPMFEKELTKVMIQKNDTVINELIRKEKSHKNMPYIGFASIPLGVAALFIAGAASNQSYKDVKLFYGTLSGLCAIGMVGSLVIDIKYSNQRKKLLERAIQIYNEKY